MPLVIHPNMSGPDEVYQSMEQGHRLAFGYGLVPWEFAYSARSWLLGYMVAGPMKLAGLFGAGPQVYLALVWAMFALPAACVALCAFFWGRRVYGTAGGIAVALVSAGWLDNVYFGGRATGEVLGGHLLIVACYLAEPGHPVENRQRLFWSGVLAGAAVMLRVQLLPALLVLLVWNWSRRRTIAIGAGVLAAIALDGIFDAMTWHYPFEPLWHNVQFNVLDNHAAAFGVAPWWFYFMQMAANWGAAMPLFFALALLGARRAKLLLVMALVILASHSLIVHKEYRFITPCVMMLSILAGFGMVELARAVRHGWKAGGRLEAGRSVSAILAVCWGGLLLIDLIGRDYKDMWNEGYDAVRVAYDLRLRPELCGVGYFKHDYSKIPGYTFLHRRVRLYDSEGAHGGDFEKDRPGYNFLVSDTSHPRDMSSFPGYRKLRCFGVLCEFERPGGCRTIVETPPPALPMGLIAARYYPVTVGVP